MTAITATMCSTAQRQGPETTQTGSDSVCPGHATGFMSLTCPLYCQYRRHVCLVSILWLKTGHMSHDERITHRKPAVNFHLLGYFSAQWFLISIQKVYLKNAVSHITKFSPCSNNVTGIRGLFDPPLHPQTEVKQTPDKTVAPSQPVL